MPCTDGGVPYPVLYNGATGRDLEAILCGLFSVLHAQGTLQQTLVLVDWAEAGVSQHAALAWWDRHNAADRERRAREAAQKEKLAIAANALSKLTPDERRALGL